jgi:hypothetical protein
MHPLLLKTDFSCYHAPFDHLVLREDNVSRFYELCMSVKTIEAITFLFIWIANKMAAYHLWV